MDVRVGEVETDFFAETDGDTEVQEETDWDTETDWNMPTDTEDLTLDEVLLLESTPGAEDVIFLSFETTQFQTVDFIYDQWRIIGEDYNPFNVNITTNQAVYDATSQENRMRIRYNETLDYAWGNSAQCCAGACYGTDEGQTECRIKIIQSTSAPRQLGYAFGLRPDSSFADGTFDKGSPNWVPIMGDTSNEERRYRTFNNMNENNTTGDEPWGLPPQDDFEEIGKYLPLKPDDVGDVPDEAKTLVVESNGHVLPQHNTGRVGISGDKDCFAVTVSGQLDLKIYPLVTYNNLHVNAWLEDRDGNVLAEGIPLDNGHTVKQAAQILTTLAEDTYYLYIEGQGAADNEHGRGYAAYGSVGYYDIRGQIEK